jgi:hypothetical protein
LILQSNPEKDNYLLEKTVIKFRSPARDRKWRFQGAVEGYFFLRGAGFVLRGARAGLGQAEGQAAGRDVRDGFCTGRPGWRCDDFSSEGKRMRCWRRRSSSLRATYRDFPSGVMPA